MGGKCFFITFEGTEGCGKTTQAALLAEYLIQQGYEVLLTREPGGTEFGCRLRDILLTGTTGSITPQTELFLYCADRAHHIQSQIRPALKDGKFVICDRFTDATVAYQGWGRGLDIEQVKSICTLAGGGLVPDMTIMLDIDPADALSRAVSRNKENLSTEDRFEKEALDFHRRVRQGYLAQADVEPHRFCVISAKGLEQEIHQRVVEAVEAYMQASVK